MNNYPENGDLAAVPVGGESAAAAGAAFTSSSSPSSSSTFRNISSSNNIPTYDGDEKAKATDFANYFCAYAQLYHQKQMLTDHNRMVSDNDIL